MTGPQHPPQGPEPSGPSGPDEGHRPDPDAAAAGGAGAGHEGTGRGGEGSSAVPAGQGDRPGQTQPSGAPGDGPARPVGGIRVQDPETARPRPASLAEQRERERVRREAEEAAWEQARLDAENAEKRAKRRKQLIGGGVAVGIVGALALTYVAVSGNDDKYENAQCVNDQNVVVDDSNCGGSQGGYGPGGLWFFYMGGSRYQYSYGSNAPVGSVANGSSTPSSGKNYANGSGKSVTSDGKTGGAVSRGGFGSKSGSGSGSKSGSDSGSKGSSGGSSGKSSGS